MFSNVRAVAVVLIAACGACAGTDVQAQTNCSAGYHSALEKLLTARGGDLNAAMAMMRASDPALPGRWIYAQALFNAKGSRPPVDDRVCVDKARVAGRVRCTRYEPRPIDALPSELVINTQPNADELRVLKALNDTVVGRGLAPEVGNNGRYTWVTQRATSDLKTYISQPEHPALCSGGREVAEFYGNALRPLQKRAEDVGEMVKKARALALTRVSEASGGSGDVPADAPLIDLVALSLKATLSAEQVAEVANEKTAIAALQRAKSGLIAAQVDAAKEVAAPEAAGKVVAAGRAVRILEAAAYAELMAERYRKFGMAVLSLPRDIQAAHAQACTCGN